jgi:two-component system OmpR family sensor kinase
MMPIALKNLIDNAIKFSPDKKAIINANTNKIEIISLGEQLKHELAYYTEAFSQEEKRSDGFGLGLYIVKTIINLHGFKLEYKYEDGKNYFIVNMFS